MYYICGWLLCVSLFSLLILSLSFLSAMGAFAHVVALLLLTLLPRFDKFIVCLVLPHTCEDPHAELSTPKKTKKHKLNNGLLHHGTTILRSYCGEITSPRATTHQTSPYCNPQRHFTPQKPLPLFAYRIISFVPLWSEPFYELQLMCEHLKNSTHIESKWGAHCTLFSLGLLPSQIHFSPMSHAEIVLYILDTPGLPFPIWNGCTSSNDQSHLIQFCPRVLAPDIMASTVTATFSSSRNLPPCWIRH